MTQPIRILALITDGFGGQGGISQYNRDLLTALSDTDNVGEIVVLPRLGQAGQQGLPARVRQQAPIFNKVKYSLSAMTVATMKGPFDLVFCGHILHAPLAAFIARRLQRPLWLQLHGLDAWTCPAPLIRWGVEQSDLVTVVSRHTKRRFLEWGNIHPARVRVLPNTVSDRYSPGPKSAQILEQYGLQGKRILLTVSRISLHDQYKGHHLVLAAMPDLLREYPDLVYVIAGDGNGRERLQHLALEQGIADSVKFFSTNASGADVELKSFVVEGAPDFVELDSKRITQVLNNLLSNGIKYTKNGGTVAVVCFIHKKGEVVGSEADLLGLPWVKGTDSSLSKEADNESSFIPNSIVVAVTDTGEGITPENMKKLWNKFIQFESSARQRDHSGTGLGLVIVKGIVEAHGGTVGVYSNIGRGSTFYFTIPL